MGGPLYTVAIELLPSSNAFFPGVCDGPRASRVARSHSRCALPTCTFRPPLSVTSHGLQRHVSHASPQGKPVRTQAKASRPALTATLGATSNPSLGACQRLETARRVILNSFSRFSSSGFSSSAPSSSQRYQRSLGVMASMSGKGFGKKNVVVKKNPAESPVPSEVSLGEGEKGSPDDDEDDVVPEVVTNRMLKRILFTVGIPLALGVLFFPLFYYLKVVKQVDVPEWLPLLVSMVTFGTAGLGITYGVLSSSWDPSREGSLLGWKEAQGNWPLIWDKMQGKEDEKR